MGDFNFFEVGKVKILKILIISCPVFKIQENLTGFQKIYTFDI